jgi:autotransporter-associated beta strand protein
MLSRRCVVAAASLMLVSVARHAAAQQIVVTQIAAMPDLAYNYQYMNYAAAAEGFDSTVFNPVAQSTYQYPTFWFQNDSENGIASGIGMPSYIGQTQNGPNGNDGEGNGEAITQIGAVLGASLVGIDKQSQTLSNGNTYDFVQMASRFYDSSTGADLVLNNIGSQGTGSFWYDQLPQILFDGLISEYYNSYPNGSAGQVRLNTIMTTSAAKMHNVIDVLAGNSTTATPNFNYQGFNYVTMTTISGNHTEPDGAGGAAYEQYMAYMFTGNATDLSDSERAMNDLESNTTNPLYEIILPFGALTAARLNAEQGTNYDVAKLVNWCFSANGSVRPDWGAITATQWGGYGVSGLIGSTTDDGGYGFSMNSYLYPMALVPLVRYDDRFANSIGKWMLNLSNSSRLFFKSGLPASNQTNANWNDAPSNYYSYEGLKESYNGESPQAGGDGTGYGSGQNPPQQWLNFAYGSGDVGVLGSIISPTNVPQILQLNLLATDFFHAAADPSYLMYNPYATQKAVQINVGTTPVNIYDAVTDQFLATDVSGTTTITIPAESSRSLVYTPVGGALVDNGQNVTVNGVVVNYRSPQLNQLYWDLNGSTAGAGGSVLTGTWGSTNSNWNTSIAGTNSTIAWNSGECAMFAAGTDGGGTYTVTVSGTQSIGGLNFQTGNVTLTGGAFSLASDSYITAASGTQTINTPISGAFALLINGAGTVVLGGANTYSGITSVESGVLQLTNPIGLENTNVDVNVNNGLDVIGVNATLGGLSGSGNINVGNQTLTVGNDNQAAEYAGSLSGTGEVVKIGTGIWTLDSANSYSGGTVLRGGEISVSSDSSLGAAGVGLNFDGGVLQITGTTFNSTPRPISMTSNGGGFDIEDPNNTFTVSQNLSGGVLSKLGVGTLVLAGTNTQTGLTLNAGTVAVASAANLGNGTISFAGTSILSFVGSQAVAVANPILVDSLSTINVADAAGVTLSSSLTMGAALTKTGEGTLTLAGAATGDQPIILRNGAVIASNSAAWANADSNGPGGIYIGDALSPSNENLAVYLTSGVSTSSGRLYFQPYALQGTKTLGGTFTSGAATINTYIQLESGLINLLLTAAPGGELNLPLGILGSTAADVTIVGGGDVSLGGIGAAQSEYYQGVTTVENGTLLLTGDDIIGNARDTYVLGNSSYTQAVQIGDSNTPAAANLSLLTDAAVMINHAIDVNNFGGAISIGGIGAYASTFNSNIFLSKGTSLVAAAGGVANFVGNITGVGGITVGGGGTVNLSGSNSYGGTNVASGTTLVIAAAESLPSGSTVVNNGVLTVIANSTSGNISGSGSLIVGNGTNPFTLRLATGTGGSSMTALTIENGSTLDITNNHLIINYGGNADPISAIRGYLASGYAGGAWNGAGIISSDAAGNTHYGVGYADSADPNDPAGLAPGTLEVEYTLNGDANLDGVVNGTDFGILAANFGQQVSAWDEGDFNYDGVVNGSDFGALAANFGQQANGADVVLPASDWAALDAFAAANGLMADVPEPTTLGLLGLGVLGLLRRRSSLRLWQGASS